MEIDEEIIKRIADTVAGTNTDEFPPAPWEPNEDEHRLQCKIAGCAHDPGGFDNGQGWCDMCRFVAGLQVEVLRQRGVEIPDPLACWDCGALEPMYMVQDDLWKSVCADGEDAMLCIGCFEKRLGRSLSSEDFRLTPEQMRQSENEFFGRSSRES